jgi:hypothetical protein
VVERTSVVVTYTALRGHDPVARDRLNLPASISLTTTEQKRSALLARLRWYLSIAFHGP